MANFREFISQDRSLLAYINADTITCILPTSDGGEVHFVGGTKIHLPMRYDKVVTALRNPHLTLPAPESSWN